MRQTFYKRLLWVASNVVIDVILKMQLYCLNERRCLLTHWLQTIDYYSCLSSWLAAIILWDSTTVGLAWDSYRIKESYHSEKSRIHCKTGNKSKWLKMYLPLVWEGKRTLIRKHISETWWVFLTSRLYSISLSPSVLFCKMGFWFLAEWLVKAQL